jgi:hypothetical protein
MTKKLTQKRMEELRKKVWGSGSVKNPIAKELLQGDGRLGGKVIPDKRQKEIEKTVREELDDDYYNSDTIN